MKNYQLCTKTVMDTSDPNITFDANGICNHYYEYQELASQLLPLPEATQKLKAVAEKIKESGKGKDYDCLMGLSGGVDSSYVAYIAYQLGLRPLVLHFDNGWNSELAVKNIENIVKKLGFDLETYVIDWEEFKDVQLSFLKASVNNIEIPTDHAITAVLYRIAAQRGIKYILSGSNTVTEGILPESWGYYAMDLKHLRGIHKIFGKVRLKTFPLLSYWKRLYYTYIKKISLVRILNLVDYNKNSAMQVLQNELNWIYYGGKHYESVFTRFFQGYILPKKFGIDKRRAHLSTLICSGQITREEALKELEKDAYPPELFEQDKMFVLKKLNLDEKEFDAIMAMPPKPFFVYPNSYKQLVWMKKIFSLLTRRKTVN